ncbi:hypothetical protein ACFQXA_22530 [Nocardiopsis composta]
MTPSTASAQPAPSTADRAWTPGWITAPQPASAGFTPNWAEEGFDGHTLRQVVRTTAGGGAVRIRLSNAYGDRPLEVRGASVAPAAGGSAVHGGRARRAAFSGSGTVLVPVGGEAVSDPVPLPVAAFDRVAVTLHLGPETGPATFHAQGYAASHRAAGDRLGDTDGSAFTETTHSWYYLTGLDVHGPAPERGAVAAIGDSITDGFGSVPDTDTRYPDALAELLAERASRGRCSTPGSAATGCSTTPPGTASGPPPGWSATCCAAPASARWWCSRASPTSASPTGPASRPRSPPRRWTPAC